MVSELLVHTFDFPDRSELSVEGLDFINQYRVDEGLAPLSKQLLSYSSGHGSTERWYEQRFMLFTQGSDGLYDKTVILNPTWHALSPSGGLEVLVCGLTITESINVRKVVKRGGITCPKCLDHLNDLRKIKR